jgi:hypothetical protein
VCAFALAAALALTTGCASQHADTPRPVSGAHAQPPSAGTAATGRPVLRAPQPDYASPSLVAAAFFTAWASIDTVHDSPGAFLVRCAPLITPALRRQLAANQPSPAAWRLMRREHVISRVHVRAVTRPAGAPAPTATRVFLRVYAVRITRSVAGLTTRSDGITLQLTRSRGRWLVARLLFW